MLHTAPIYHEELARLRHGDVLREARKLHEADAVGTKTRRAAARPKSRRKHALHRPAAAH